MLLYLIFIRYGLLDPSIGSINVVENSTSLIFNYPCSSTTVCTPYYVDLHEGYYLLEVWGAQGGSHDNINGGKGGYSKGMIKVEGSKRLYVYIGGKGIFRHETTSNTCISGGFNGGGGSCSYKYHTSGGGASDIRDGMSLGNRLIVAGGGGGYAGGGGVDYQGGYGGGNTGGSAYGFSKTYNLAFGTIYSNGGNQGSGGTSYIKKHTYQNTNGALGVGGNGAGAPWYCGGGGGGYYGGGGGFDVTGGGGGSGYIGGVKSAFLINASTIAGNMFFPSPENINIIGRTGNGAAKITEIFIQTSSFPYKSNFIVSVLAVILI